MSHRCLHRAIGERDLSHGKFGVSLGLGVGLRLGTELGMGLGMRGKRWAPSEPRFQLNMDDIIIRVILSATASWVLK